MLFPKSSLQLGKVIGQGEEQGETLLFSCPRFYIITLNLGESGLVYQGYVMRGACKELVAIKTGKGITVHTVYTCYQIHFTLLTTHPSQYSSFDMRLCYITLRCTVYM